jgi:hypothetical protein
VRAHRFEVSDDSGFLALVDPDAYEGFVDPEWTLESLLAQFRAAMSQRSLLIWGTGREDFWNVDVVIDGPEPPVGFRRVTGPITTSGRLHVTNYESLTMAAQFPHVRLPERHARNDVFRVPAGDYACDIVQLNDPADDDAPDGHAAPDFVINLRRGAEAAEWQAPAWREF